MSLKRLSFFVTITDSLGIVENEDIILDSDDITDPIYQVLFKFSRHPSIQNILSKRTLIISHLKKFEMKILKTKLVN